jgi:hypothetical protein
MAVIGVDRGRMAAHLSYKRDTNRVDQGHFPPQFFVSFRDNSWSILSKNKTGTTKYTKQHEKKQFHAKLAKNAKKTASAKTHEPNTNYP